jgi:hypothetical protein
MELGPRHPDVAGAERRAKRKIDGQLVVRAVDAAILEDVRPPRPLDECLGDFFRQGLLRVAAEFFQDGERVEQQGG